MADVTGNDILSYHGDPAAGLANTDVQGVINSDKITETARELALQSAASNLNFYRQKVDERNQAYKMIDDDQLQLDNIPEEHRAQLDAEKKKITDIFAKYNGDVFSDPSRYRELQGQIAKTKDQINQSHKWYIWLQNELKTRSEMNNPVDQAKMDQHINQQWAKNKQDFWSLPDPYAPLTHFDLNVVAAKPLYAPPEIIHKGDYDIVNTRVDANKTFDLYQKNWANPNFNHMFHNYIFGDPDGTYGGFLAGPNAAKDIQRVNDALRAIGVAPLGVTADPINPSKFVADKDRPDQIAAKIALADNPALLTESKFAEDRVSSGIKRGQLGEEIRHNKATEAIDWAKIQAEKDRWAASVKGPEENKNAAWTYAKSLVDQLSAVGEQTANKSTWISPDKVRKLTAEQLKYLGIEGPNTAGTGTLLNPLKLNPDDGIQIEEDPANPMNRIIRVMSGATPPSDSRGIWTGTWDNSRTTSLSNIAINKLNEENIKSGTKERNAYEALDLGGGNSSSTSGGSFSVSGGKSQYQALDGKTYSIPSLKAMGYTDEDIANAIKLGNLK